MATNSVSKRGVVDFRVDHDIQPRLGPVSLHLVSSVGEIKSGQGAVLATSSYLYFA